MHPTVTREPGSARMAIRGDRLRRVADLRLTVPEMNYATRRVADLQMRLP